MECPECKAPLMIASSDYDLVNDDNPETPTELYSVLSMVCVNPKCGNFCGYKDAEKKTITQDLNNPRIVVDKIRNRIK